MERESEPRANSRPFVHEWPRLNLQIAKIEILVSHRVLILYCCMESTVMEDVCI